MCGIAGLTAGESSEADREALRRMCETLGHRGPDDEGLDWEGGLGLGMRRLSIIDPEGGRQPYFSEDRGIRVVFNGEIYNYRELRERLAERGHTFASDADGEVIAHLWEEHGEGFPERLNGMFAIALHDVRRGRLVLVRDRIGIKPLYYHESPSGGLVFGSEVKAVLASGRVPRTLDGEALREFLAWEYVPAPRTLHAAVRKLGPGELLSHDLGRGTGHARSWWSLPPRPDRPAPADRDAEGWADEVDVRLGTAVRRQLVSDVPLGAFLSGGVDSSLVVAHMGPGARTFSIGFEDPSYDERTWARRVARHLGVSHETETVRSDVAGLLDPLLEYLDDPIADFSIFPTYLVSEVARREVKVALSGDGGDELFGGYETYVAERADRLWRRVPRFLRQGILGRAARALPPAAEKKGWRNMVRRFARGAAHDPALGHARWRLFAGAELQRRLFTDGFLAESGGAGPDVVERHVRRLFGEAGDRPAVDRGLYVDMRSYLADNCLVKVDRMSMACSLEVRVPFLDQDVVELAFRVPPELKVRGRRTKPLLKRVAARHVPEECVYRPKEGFSIPIKHWLRSRLRERLEDRLDPAALAEEGIFRPDVVRRLVGEHMDGTENHSHVLWALLVYREWRGRWGA